MGGAQQIAGVRPDLTCLGKIIGGGLPVGAYGGRAEVMDLVAPAGPGVSSRHAVGKPARDDRRPVVAPGTVAKAVSTSRQAGTMLAAGLAEAARDAGVPLQVNAFGSVLTPFFTSEAVTDYQSALKADTEPTAGSSTRCSIEESTRRPPSSKPGSSRQPTLSETSRRPAAQGRE